LSLFDKFILNQGDIEIEDNNIKVSLKKKKTLPLILENMNNFKEVKYDWLNHKKIVFQGASYS